MKNIELDKNCVMYNAILNECKGINSVEFKKGHKCETCAFRKTQEEYIKQTGRTYEEEMKEVKKYVNKH